ncbi:hypothetical protein LFZ32_22460, partial [Salmonella enterica subsp. enterica serovar Newport str. L0167]
SITISKAAPVSSDAQPRSYFFIRLPIVVDKDYPAAKGHGQNIAMDPEGLLYALLCTMLNAIRQILLCPATHTIWRYITLTMR